MKYNDSDYVEVKTGSDEWDNAIRKFGVVAACEWFGYGRDSEFTKETVRILNERLGEDKLNIEIARNKLHGEFANYG